MTILTDFAYFYISPKELYSDFSYTLAFVTLKYERNRIFHSCCEILNLSDFYRQALLIFSVFVLSNEMTVLQSLKHLHLGIVLSSSSREINMLNM